MSERLKSLEPGMPIPYGGNRVVHVSPELARAFRDGDMLIVVQDTGQLLHVPRDDWNAAAEAVDAAANAFAGIGAISQSKVLEFYEMAAQKLDDQSVFSHVERANREDVESARSMGRPVTRLALSVSMRRDMGAGLRGWANASIQPGRSFEVIRRAGWDLHQVVSGLGVVGFVFEGRPNVLTDALGLLRTGNTVVFRIGSAALGTARALMRYVIAPSLDVAGLPEGSVSLVDAPSHASGWALFSDPRLSLAVARGSGEAVLQLGAVARQKGTPVSLHGTGGAWIVAAETAVGSELEAAVRHSLDRKVCNTVNTVCVVESRARELVPHVLQALDQAGRARSAVSKLHVTASAADVIPPEWFADVEISRADGKFVESRTETIKDDQLGHEWEWDVSPEMSLTVVPDVEAAIRLFNEQSPRFIASLISSDDDEHVMFFDTIEAPFVGNGFTRWVDGQYALQKPEMGLTNWQSGRLMGRGGILVGDDVFTVRSRAWIDDLDLHR